MKKRAWKLSSGTYPCSLRYD